MASSFTLVLDTRAPANPTILINEGASLTGDQVVWLRIETPDYQGGPADVSQMKVWGDVDPAADTAIGVTEDASQWLAYVEQIAVRLSDGANRKVLYARLRDDVGNETLPFSDFIDFDTTLPIVEIVTAVPRSRISKVAPYNALSFTWQVNQPILGYQVRVVPSTGSPYNSGAPLRSTAGSLNVSGSSRIEALTQVITTVNGADLEATSPGDTSKVVKVFVQGLDGRWSA